jgi:putative RecB family exonuclease
MRISNSSYNSYNLCPRQYKFNYIDKVYVPERAEFYFGKLIHTIIQYALKKDPIFPSEDELLLMLKNAWKVDAFKDEEEADQYYTFGIDIIKKFYASHKPALRNIIATEKFFEIPLNNKHVLTGKIDRIDKLPIGAIEIIDYKTDKTLPSQSDVDKNNQLTIYNLATENLWPEVKEIRLTLYFLKFSTKMSSSRRPDEIESVKENLIKTADAIEKDKQFAPKKNPLCNWCSYQNICPLWRNKIGNCELEIENCDDIDDILKEYLEQRKKLASIENKIKSYFEASKTENYKYKNILVSRTNDKLKFKKVE